MSGACELVSPKATIKKPDGPDSRSKDWGKFAEPKVLAPLAA